MDAAEQVPPPADGQALGQPQLPFPLPLEAALPDALRDRRQHHVEEARHDDHAGGVPPAELPQDHRRLQARHIVDGAAMQHRKIEARRLLQHVRQRQDGNQMQRHAVRHDGARGADIGGDVAMAQHRALGFACGARGEDDLGDVISGGMMIAARCGACEVDVCHRDRAHALDLQAGPRREQQRRLGLGGHAGEELGGRPHVHRHHDQPGCHGAEMGSNRHGAVHGRDHHPGAGIELQLMPEIAGEGRNQLTKRCVAPAVRPQIAAHRNSRLPAVGGHCPVQHCQKRVGRAGHGVVPVGLKRPWAMKCRTWSSSRGDP